jgi:catechol-2,3-dioxygenase
MLSNFNVSPVLAVKDLASATQFYGGVLGLQPATENDYEIYYKTGGGTLEVYVSSYAGTNQATAATWEVTGIETLVSDLKDKGINFEHYDMPGAKLEGDIHVMEGMKAAWFKDPDGNILCLHQGS